MEEGVDLCQLFLETDFFFFKYIFCLMGWLLLLFGLYHNSSEIFKLRFNYPFPFHGLEIEDSFYYFFGIYWSRFVPFQIWGLNYFFFISKNHLNNISFLCKIESQRRCMSRVLLNLWSRRIKNLKNQIFNICKAV